MRRWIGSSTSFTRVRHISPRSRPTGCAIRPAYTSFRDRTLSAVFGLSARLRRTSSSLLLCPVAAPVVTTATPIVTPVAQVVAPVTNPVSYAVTPVASPLVTPLLAPVVTSVSTNMTLPGWHRLGSSSLLYETDYPRLVGADSLQRSGNHRRRLTIACWTRGYGRIQPEFRIPGAGEHRCRHGGSGAVQSDPYGHGTHVTSIVAGARKMFHSATPASHRGPTS